MELEQFISSIPCGCRFNPTDEELVGKFLFKKINNVLSDLENQLVCDCDLYGHKEPWALWDEFSQNLLLTTGDLYFFTELKKKPNGYRILRAVGEGTWHGEDKGRLVKAVTTVDDGGAAQEKSIQARRKRFNYRNKNSPHHCRWILHEFSMLNSTTNWVLCRLRNTHVSDEKVSAVKRAFIVIDQDPNSDSIISEKRLKVTYENNLIAQRNFNSNSEFVDPEKQICNADTSNEFGYDTTAAVDCDLLTICYGSEGYSVSVHDLFDNIPSFTQSDSSPDQSGQNRVAYWDC